MLVSGTGTKPEKALAGYRRSAVLTTGLLPFTCFLVLLEPSGLRRRNVEELACQPRTPASARHAAAQPGE
jgi:hypothetical protein